MTAPATAFFPDILEEHFEELPFLAHLRQRRFLRTKLLATLRKLMLEFSWCLRDLCRDRLQLLSEDAQLLKVGATVGVVRETHRTRACGELLFEPPEAGHAIFLGC